MIDLRFVCHADYATHNGLDLRRGEKCSFSIILYAVEEEKRGSVISARNSTVGHNKREKEISRLFEFCRDRAGVGDAVCRGGAGLK